MRSIILLGGNDPSTPVMFEEAKKKIKERCGEIIYEGKDTLTKPEDDVDQDDFLNSIVVLNSALSPFELLRKLQEVETELGRVRDLSRPKGPRNIDLDILFYEDFQIRTEDLLLPHPQVRNRLFVSKLLAELPQDLKDIVESNI